MAQLWHRLRTVIVLVLGLAMGLLLGVWIFTGEPVEEMSSQMRSREARPPGPAPYEGSTAPDFKLEDLAGEDVTLREHRGDIVVLNFWATWCGPCRVEMPDLEHTFSRYSDQGLVVLGVNFDEPAGDVEAFKTSLDITFPLLLDPGGVVQRQYQVTGYPTTVFVDREGLIQIRHIGLLRPAQLDRYLRKMGIDR
jgi:peroxiredoxin